MLVRCFTLLFFCFEETLGTYNGQPSPEQLLLKNRPKSIYKIPLTSQRMHAIPIIDMHSHAKVPGIHIDDPELQPLLQKCGRLKMPVSIHVAEPQWMYQNMDSTNDGLMNAFIRQIDGTAAGFKNHKALINSLEKAIQNNMNTTFIACHFANCETDLEVLGRMLNQYPNLFANISARYGETAPIPRYMSKFYKQHSKKLLYGTDMGTETSMYQTTFRILETDDEHFYETELFNYHWPCNGFDLDKRILKKLYYKNAFKILKRL